MPKELSTLSCCEKAAPLDRLQQQLSGITNKPASACEDRLLTGIPIPVEQENNPALLRLQSRLRISAMNFLARREYSRLELETRLGNKKKFRLEQAYKLIVEKGEERFIPGFASAEADIYPEAKDNGKSNNIADADDVALAWLGDHFLGALNGVLTQLEVDGLLCDQRFAESYLRSRSRAGFGPIRIRNELKQRGVAIAPPYLHEIDWFDLVREIRSKKFGVALPNDLKARAKQIQFLIYRGFPRELISDIFNE